MKLSMGLWDSLFGEKVTVDVPDGAGNTVKRTVTKKWFDEMIRQQKMSVIPAIRVHMLDALKGYQVVYWTIGDDIEEDTANTYKDPDTGELYAMTGYENGSPTTAVLNKEIYMAMRSQFEI